ncbi:hypothetical protein HD806DRAFT_518988 [Xylariaceae sp. AK1471]|nr:hypothetical protein HD806DRAFT_518988 [Xylariaceae sp. AK1471]
MDTVPPNGLSSAVTTHQTAWRRACVTCTKAKRQCTKQVPRCRRCLDKGLPCTYLPPRRPHLSAAAENDETLVYHDSTALPIEEGLVTGSANAANLLDVSGDFSFSFLQMTETELESLQLPTDAGPSGGLPQTMALSDALVSLRDAFWFLAPESWAAEFHEPASSTLETERSMKQYIEHVQSWMRKWVTEGHSPLHHRELYSFHMPRHIQDAYTAMNMYMGKTRGTEATVYRILEDRVSQLLQDQAVKASLSSGGEDRMSIFDRLSRVQALLCYQIIRLFDGDICMRAQAEALIPTLFLWNKEMLETVKDNLDHPECFLVSSPFDPSLQFNAPSTKERPSAFSSKVVWRAWILAESVRRTWQVTNVVQEIYQFFKRRWAECPGRLPSTMRRTLWDAPSAYLWTKELEGGKDPLLVPMARLEAIFAHTTPAEVDDFNMALFAIYGIEEADQWLEEMRNNKPQLLPGVSLSKGGKNHNGGNDANDNEDSSSDKDTGGEMYTNNKGNIGKGSADISVAAAAHIVLSILHGIEKTLKTWRITFEEFVPETAERFYSESECLNAFGEEV